MRIVQVIENEKANNNQELMINQSKLLESFVYNSPGNTFTYEDLAQGKF